MTTQCLFESGVLEICDLLRGLTGGSVEVFLCYFPELFLDIFVSLQVCEITIVVGGALGFSLSHILMIIILTMSESTLLSECKEIKGEGVGLLRLEVLWVLPAEG